MKKLLILLVMFFSFTSNITLGEERTTGQDEIQILTIDNHVMIDSIGNYSEDGVPYQIVYYKDGYMEVFMDYLYIDNIQLRQAYSTHKNVNKDLMSELKLLNTGVDIKMLDYSLFNQYLKENGYKCISYADYGNYILLPAKLSTTVKALKPINFLDWYIMTVILFFILVIIYVIIKNLISIKRNTLNTVSHLSQRRPYDEGNTS